MQIYIYERIQWMSSVIFEIHKWKHDIFKSSKQAFNSRTIHNVTKWYEWMLMSYYRWYVHCARLWPDKLAEWAKWNIIQDETTPNIHLYLLISLSETHQSINRPTWLSAKKRENYTSRIFPIMDWCIAGISNTHNPFLCLCNRQKLLAFTHLGTILPLSQMNYAYVLKPIRAYTW